MYITLGLTTPSLVSWALTGASWINCALGCSTKSACTRNNTLIDVSANGILMYRNSAIVIGRLS
jgi:hypothetical protein